MAAVGRGSDRVGLPGGPSRDGRSFRWPAAAGRLDPRDRRPACRGRCRALPPDTLRVRHEPYRSNFALDAAQGGVAVDPVLGSGEGLQVLLRDMMGNRIVFLQLGNTTISTRDFADNFSAGVAVLDLSRRLNRGLSVYHHAGHYFDEIDRPYFERRVGATGLLSYPLSRFTRLETTFGLAYAEKDKPAADLKLHGAIATHYVSWIARHLALGGDRSDRRLSRASDPRADDEPASARGWRTCCCWRTPGATCGWGGTAAVRAATAGARLRGPGPAGLPAGRIADAARLSLARIPGHAGGAWRTSSCACRCCGGS